MPDTIPIPLPIESEQHRQLCEAVAGLYYVVGLIVEHAKEFIPGEAIDELLAAWDTSKKSFEEIATKPLDSIPQPIHQNELFGVTGRLKLSTLSRLKDSFLGFFFSHPLTDEKRARAADAVINYFEYGATVVSSIPGCDAIEEFLLLVKQLISIRAKRGV